MRAATVAGPSIATTGSQVCRGKTGVLTAKPASRSRKTLVSRPWARGVASNSR